jgi:chemotaxis protein CheC
MVLGDHPPSPQDIGEMYSSAMLEVGNIIISSYLNAIGTLTNIACVAEPPFLAVDMAYPIMQSVICAAAPDEPAGLALDTEIQDTDYSTEGHFLYLPTPGGIGMLFDALGVREAA